MTGGLAVGARSHHNPDLSPYGFSKDMEMYRAASYFVGSRDDFCWAVRTLRVREPRGTGLAGTAAMAAGLSDHVWTP